MVSDRVKIVRPILQRCRTCGQEVVTASDRPLCGKCFQSDQLDRQTWPIIALVIGISMLAAMRGFAGVVTEGFLDRVAWVESHNNPMAIGAHGELGAYQIKSIAVEECNRVYGWRLSHTAVVSQVVGRAVARGYSLICERELVRMLGRQPTSSELLRAYQLGPAGFARQLVRPRSPATTSTRGRAWSGFRTYHMERSSGVDPRAGHFPRGPRR
jgi:ribosomal protein S27AE